MVIHKIKCIPPYFDYVYNELKLFELRYNDRNYKVGDILYLYEGLNIKGLNEPVKSFKQTGNFVLASITYILSDVDFGLVEGYVILGINIIFKS